MLKKFVVKDYRQTTPELFYTADLIDKKDKLLYDKLKSWPHWDRKYLIIILVPKESGKGGIPIWEKIEELTFRLQPRFIKGYIDVVEKLIVLNPKYNIREEHLLIEDISYEPTTGKLIKVSLPPDELEFWEEEIDR